MMFFFNIIIFMLMCVSLGLLGRCFYFEKSIPVALVSDLLCFDIYIPTLSFVGSTDIANPVFGGDLLTTTTKMSVFNPNPTTLPPEYGFLYSSFVALFFDYLILIRLTGFFLVVVFLRGNCTVMLPFF